jgi:hypothetical protein
VCDIQTIVIHTNFTNTVKRVVTITLDDLLTPAGLSALRDVFFEPERFRAPQTAEQVAEQAAADFARLAARRDAATGGQRTRLGAELSALLLGFARELAAVRVLDPACGSANFLYVALKQLLDLEKEVNRLAGELGANTFFPSVSPEQLRGVEVNEDAHELAQVTVWIGYIQWLRDNGYGLPSEPILKPLDTIRHMDAILAFDEHGRPLEPPWPAADVIVGNPPFLGGKRLHAELGDEYVDSIFALYDGRVPHEADLVTYWFERARALVESGEVQRAGCWRRRPFAAGPTARCSSASSRAATSSWPGPTVRGC